METDMFAGAPAKEQVPIRAQIACVQRELAMRERVYPRWVSGGRMSAQKSAQEMLAMRAVLETLESLASST